MPIHDWTRVDAGLFHHFHQQWVVILSSNLNANTLPTDHYALLEQPANDLTTDLRNFDEPTNAALYAARADRITVRHQFGEVIAVIEIVSPGTKGSRDSLASFVKMSGELLRGGVNLMVIDLLPPCKHDPQGIHQKIWSDVEETDFELPVGKKLAVSSYDAKTGLTAYVEPVSVGDPLPEMPLFLQSGQHVPAPLESSYQSTWAVLPEPLKRLLE